MARVCVQCGAVPLSQCSRCKAAYYCGVECQRKHWKSHKDVCKEIRVRAEAKKEADEAAGKALLREQCAPFFDIQVFRRTS